ncbi:MAG: hypothetical protein HZC18_06030 [Candidatus Omnitrophica bacterium]|nr:hypothetical protein [Candidatus Omnitrophota bacterium]
MLKQITASIMYPEGKTGSAFWSRVQQKVKEKFGAEDIPVNMFNKIWIVPDKAEVYEINGSAYVVDSHLKVMLEEDYFALKNDANRSTAVGDHDAQAVGAVSSDVVREVLLPEIEKEVNEGKNFANLRQIYNANILATWYKMSLKDSLLGQVYIDKNKVSGVDIKDKSDKLKIYEQYVDAFKKGAYELVKKDYDPETQQVISRKYFAGGATFVNTPKLLVQDFKRVSSPLQLSDGEQIKLFQNVASSPMGTEDFRVTFDLNMAKPTLISSSPIDSTSSKALSVAYHTNPQVFVNNLKYNLEAMMQKAGVSGDINEMTQAITDLAQNFSGQLNSSSEISGYLSARGLSQPAVETAIKNWDQLTAAAVNNVDFNLAAVRQASMTNPQRATQDTLSFLRTDKDLASQIPETEARVLASEIPAIMTQNAGTVNRGGFETALNQSPALKGVSDQSKRALVQNMGRLASVLTNEVDDNMPLIFHEVTTNRLKVEQRMSDYLKEIPEAAPRADMLASKVATFVLQNPAIKNTINFAIEINQNEAFNKDLSPQEREVLTANASALARVAINRFDVATASFAFNIKENLPLVQGNSVVSLMNFNPNIRRDEAEKGVTTITNMVSRNPGVAWNFDTLREGIRSNPDLTEGLKKELTRPGVIESMVYTSAQPFNPAVGAMPAMFVAYPAESITATERVLQSMPDVPFDSHRIPVVAAAVGKIAVRPEGFSSSNLENDFMKEGLTPGEAQQLGKKETREYIATGIAQQLQRSNKDLNLEVAGWSAAVIKNPNITQGQLRDSFSKIPGISSQDASQAADRFTQNPGSLVSKKSIENILNDMPRAVVDRVTSSEGINAFNKGMQAAFKQQDKPTDLGGIDINPAFLKLLVKRDGKGVPVPVGNVNLKDTDIYGFEPVISKVEQVDNLPAFIGIEEGPGTAATVRNFQ